MSCSLEFKKAVLDTVGKLELAKSRLGAGMLANGESMDVTIHRLKEVASKPPSEAVQLLGEMSNTDVYHTALRAQLGDKLKLATRKGAREFGAAKEYELVKASKNGSEVSLVVADGAKRLKFVVGSNDDSGTSKVGSNGVQVKFDYSVAQAVSRASNLVDSLNTELGREARHDMLLDFVKTDLASLDEKVVDLAEYTKINYEHGNVEAMKDTMRMLDVLGGGRTSPEYLAYADSIMDSMHPRFFNHMDMYIKENTGTSQGWVAVDKKAIILDVSVDPNSRMTEAEVYLHELLHTMTTWAWNSGSLEAGRLKRQVRHVIKTAMQKTSWKNLLAVDESMATAADITTAKDLYEKIFNSKNADEEFIVHALSNPAVMKHLKTVMVKGDEKQDVTMLQKIAGFFGDLMNIVMGNYDFSGRNKNAYDQVHALAFKLGEINGSARNKIEKSWLTKLSDSINYVDDVLAAKIEKATTSLIKSGMKTLEPYPENSNKLVQTLFMIKYLAKATVNPAMRSALGTQYFSGVLGLKPESSIRELFGTLLEESDYKQAANWLGLKNTKIDTLRNSVINQTVSNVKKWFNSKLTELEESSLTEVLLDTNATGALSAGLTRDRLVMVLKDESKLKETIEAARAKIRAQVSSDKEFYWAVNQADALGYYMATHLGNEASILNAATIASSLGNTELVNDLTILSSMTALKHTDKATKELVATLMEKEPDGVDNVIDTYEAFKKESEETLFANDKNHMIDGYSKEVFDDTVEIAVAPIADRAKYEADGFKYKGRVKTPEQVSDVEYGIFVTDSFSRGERLRGAVNLGGRQSRGVSIREMVYREVDWDSHSSDAAATMAKAVAESKLNLAMAKMGSKAAALQSKMSSGILDMSKFATGLVPILDADNKIVDYRAMMSKKQKKELLSQHTEVSEVLSRSLGSIVDKSRREEHNSEVLKLLVEDMENNWEAPQVMHLADDPYAFYKENTSIGGKLDSTLEYRLISPNSNDPKMKELYAMLPDSFKKYIQSREDKVLAVPAELMNILFGYKHFQITDIPGVRALPNVIKKVINMVESYFIDLTKIVKTSILLKMPIILVSNIVSNIIYAFNTGMTPVEILKHYRESFADVKAFMNNNREKIKLELELSKARAQEVRSGISKKEQIKALEDKLNRVNKEMEDSPVKELFDLGMYQSVVEDVETSKLNDTNKVSDMLDSVTNKMPSVVSTPLKWLYLSKDTAWYKINQEVLQMSDLVARDVMNRKQKQLDKEVADGNRKIPQEFRDFMLIENGVVYPKEGKLEGKMREDYLKHAEKSRQYNLLKTFVNYNQPNGKAEEYLNRIGLLMFTKYVKNIQRVIASSASKHPLRSAITVLAASAMLNADYIQEQAFAVKGFGGFDGDFSVFNIFPVYNPIGNVLDLINPPLVKLVS